jgi:uncharacterized protein (TIGR04255 family)
MVKQKHLEKAPIIEALIDFRVNLPTEFTVDTFSNISDDFTRKYPKKESLVSGEFEFKIEEGKATMKPPIDKGVQGYVYKSDDDKNVAQFRIDGFTFSRLSPYTSWDEVFSEASGLWKLYCSKSSPSLISRIAVRYINRLDIPASLTNLRKYLTAPPEVPKKLPQQMNKFLTRVMIQEDDITANIIQALDKSLKPEHIGVILDIDVYKVNKKGFDIEKIPPEFDKLRELKNLIFFESITEEMARLCE